MNPKSLSLAILFAVLGVIVGFILANSMNRSELTALRSENEQLKKSAADSSSSLSAQEINTAIARADQSPTDATMQRNVGIAIYRYAAMKQDVALLQQAIRILNRAVELKPDDSDVVLTLGNAHFDVGYFGKDNEALGRSRELYTKVLANKPDDPNVRTDLALTYFLETPPDFERSVAEFRKSLAIDPRNERTLQFITQALAKQNKIEEASTYLDQLRDVNPRNESINELASLIATQQPAG